MRGTAAARWLGLLVRISLGHGGLSLMGVVCCTGRGLSLMGVVCCTGRDLCVGLITRQEETYRVLCRNLNDEES